ncbi:uncharacterized protein K444DRAFT_612819 [Hyaloscypha bicolor E]|uniref:Uncharacterized protein n=1 Tax=Hyaloscypha bicolor E TaxID=1095630 RepID=A0A2J6TB72_9HELO|nr:uncharacterized protein K444DRAFT_612819 [Hyaloscypha bicolor E]PMD60218.1 hypothetical protein K444DRAFT_612819 [Hyaloscypha bicolor E]
MANSTNMANSTTMANSTNDRAWDDFIRSMPSPTAILEEPFAPDSQPLSDIAFPEAGDLSNARDWFSSNLALASSPRPPKVPSRATNDSFPARRSNQLYVSRPEFYKVVGRLADKLTKLQESVQELLGEHKTVLANHQKLSVWSMDMNGAIASVAQQIVRLRVPVAEWDMPEQREQA